MISRFDSYYNYCKLFNYILSADTPVNLELPNQWLWEIIDEFIYQFQVNRICDSRCEHFMPGIQNSKYRIQNL